MVSEIFALLPGLLNFPKAFDEAGGILVGIVVQASLIVFIVAALLILGKYKVSKYFHRPFGAIGN